MPATSVKLLQNAAVAMGNGTTFRGNDCVRVVVQVSGTFVATVTWEVSVNGTDWVGILAAPPSTGTGALTATAAGAFAMAAWPYLRARISAWTSGAVTVVAASMP